MEGYIFLHRQILQWEWWDDINVSRLFLVCLLQANHIDKTWRGNVIKRGQFITSIEKLAQNCNFTIQNCRTSLTKLKSTGELTIKTTNKFSLIEVINYDKYQTTNKPTNKQLTNNQQTTNKQLTTTKNDKNDKNDKNKKEGTSLRFVPPTLQEASEYCTERNNTVDPTKFIDFYESKGWMVGKNKMKDWKAAIRNWENRDNQNKPAKRLEAGIIINEEEL